MEYQGPPITIQEFCVTYQSETRLGFNGNEPTAYDEEAYRFLSVIVPNCTPSIECASHQTVISPLYRVA